MRRLSGPYRVAVGAALIALGVLVAWVATRGGPDRKPRAALGTTSTTASTQSQPSVSPTTSGSRAKRKSKTRRRVRAIKHAAAPRASTPAHAAPPPRHRRTPSAVSAMPARYTVTLVVPGGRDVRARACGIQHHYRVFGAGSTIRYRGVVRPLPARRWKVKVKLKACRGSGFEKVVDLQPNEHKARGAYDGSFAAPSRGFYFARASLYVAGALRAKSDKRHIATG
jgi:hypothetical protein